LGLRRTSIPSDLHGFLIIQKSKSSLRISIDCLISSHLFQSFPQGSHILHSFRTAKPQFSVAAQNEMRESSFTASVKVALPVIVQGWFCGD
jgi:hypothetical protein